MTDPQEEGREPRGAFYRLLDRLALGRPEQRAWALYDWANSAMVTVIVTAVFPIFYRRVAAAELSDEAAQARFSGATAIALAFIAVLAPLLGSLADRARGKKALLGAFLILGAGSCAALFLVHRGDWLLASILLVLANVGASGSFVFYDSLLPHVARSDEIDRLSTSGFALGYLGGGLLLAFDLVLIKRPDLFGLPSGEGLTPAQESLPTRIAFLTVAVWWLAFSIPLFRRVPEPAGTAGGRPAGMTALARDTVRGLVETLRELGRFRQALLMLVAFLIYNDGIATIIRMATLYGDGIGIGRDDLILAILVVQFAGIPFTLLFGALAGRIGAKPAILIGVVAYLGIGLLAWGMTRTWHFYTLALLVAVVQGGTQALSRSLFASMIPRHKSAEFFSLFAVLDRFAGIAGPALFSIVIAWTGSQRAAILPVVLFFLAGGALLTRVDVDAGRRAARAAERELDRAARAG